MKNILCIDDIDSNLYTIEAVLMNPQDKPYKVITALSAKEGLEILLKEEIDLILLDVMMPEVDGFECAQMIRSNKRTKDIPIIFVTAKKDNPTIAKCYESGGNDYVNKPFNEFELLARISFHLQYQEREKLLIKQKEYVQNILDGQQSLIAITDGTKILNANKSLLKFYDVDSVDTFRKKYTCICHTFEKEEEYFHLDLVQIDKNWVDALIKLLKSEDTLVKIIQDKEYVFIIDAVPYENYYIVTLTDTTKLLELHRAVEHAANFDHLTQIYNRNKFYEIVDKRMNSKRKEEKDFVLLMFDIDFFKKINDTYGHPVGDDVLKSLASLVQKNIRNDDLFARWGGEEFILVVRTDIQTGLAVAENLRKEIEAYHFGKAKKLTCSFGITESKENDTIDAIIKRADEALYDAKKSGRNKVCQK